jgi:hypothetical protein
VICECYEAERGVSKNSRERPASQNRNNQKALGNIKKHNLQDANNKRNINADENLLTVFDREK